MCLEGEKGFPGQSCSHCN